MKDLKQRIEEIGVVMEGLRSTPVEARVFALLLLSDPPYRSFDEIREILEASKSAVSNALSRMQQHGAVSYITFPGDRKRYFRLDMDKMQKKLIDAAKAIEAFNGILQQALVYREDNEDQQFNQDLKKLLDFQIYLSESLQQAVAKWQWPEA